MKYFKNIFKFCMIFIYCNTIQAYATITLNKTPVTFSKNSSIFSDEQGNFFILEYGENSKNITISYLDFSSEIPKIVQLKNLGVNHSSYLGYYKIMKHLNNDIYLFHTNNSNNIEIDLYTILLSKSGFYFNEIIPIELNNPLNASFLQNNIVICNKNLYIIKDNNMKIYNRDSSMLEETTLNNETNNLISIISNVSNSELYAITNNNNVLKFDSSNLNFVNSYVATGVTNLKFLSDSIFVTSSGEFFKKENNTDNFKKFLNKEMSFYDFPNGINLANFNKNLLLASTDKNTITIFDIKENEIIDTINFDTNEKILDILTSNDKTIIVTTSTNSANGEKNFYIISQNDIKNSEKNFLSDSDEISIDENNKNILSETNNIVDLSSEITSTIHNIDYVNHIIDEIAPGTTIGEMKNNLDFNGYSLSFKDAGGNHKSGNSVKIGTGYTISFIKDGIEKAKFTCIVKGDVTGTGTITSTDITKVTNYLLDKTNLSEIYLKAADIDTDGEVTTVDLFLMEKLTQK